MQHSKANSSHSVHASLGPSHTSVNVRTAPSRATEIPVATNQIAAPREGATPFSAAVKAYAPPVSHTHAHTHVSLVTDEDTLKFGGYGVIRSYETYLTCYVTDIPTLSSRLQSAVSSIDTGGFEIDEI